MLRQLAKERGKRRILIERKTVDLELGILRMERTNCNVMRKINEIRHNFLLVEYNTFLN